MTRPGQVAAKEFRYGQIRRSDRRAPTSDRPAHARPAPNARGRSAERTGSCVARQIQRGIEPASGTILHDVPVGASEGESWRYNPPADHSVCWIALATGSLVVPGNLAAPEPLQAGELAVFAPSNQAIDFHADTDTEFVLGSAQAIRMSSRLGITRCTPVRLRFTPANGTSPR